MIVADASALGSLAGVQVLDLALDALDVHTTDLVIDTLEIASAFHGPDGDGARAALGDRDGLVVHRGDCTAFESSRVDPSQGSCATLAVELDANALLTDDLLALPELERLVPCPVANSPVVLAALVRRGVLAHQDARFRLEGLAERKDWLGRPVRRRALASFDVTG